MYNEICFDKIGTHLPNVIAINTKAVIRYMFYFSKPCLKKFDNLVQGLVSNP